jgi:hypothetical protein
MAPEQSFGPLGPFKAVEWIQRAEGGGTQSQVFRLGDGRHALVKFPENGQGLRVLPNEFFACRLAARLALPVNRCLLVEVDGSLLHKPKADGACPPAFSGGTHVGLIRYQGADPAGPGDARFAGAINAAEVDHILVFDQLVARTDGRQLLVYPASQNEGPPGKGELFGSTDYGHAFGGSPGWSLDSLNGLAPVQLPTANAQGTAYSSGEAQRGLIDRLRALTRSDFDKLLAETDPPRWGVTREEAEGLLRRLEERARQLVLQFDQLYRPQMEAFNGS